MTPTSIVTLPVRLAACGVGLALGTLHEARRWTLESPAPPDRANARADVATRLRRDDDADG